MESLFDRLGLYDFFNVIMAGGIVLLYSLGVTNQWSILWTESWTSGLFLLLLAYVWGIVCQEIGRFITETWLRIKDKQIEHMLETKEEVEERLRDKLKNKEFKHEKVKQFLVKQARVINNDCKVRVYKKYINDILIRANERGKVLDEERIKYGFAYCIYYIENKGKNQKVEKMRALYGMAQNLVGTGVIIVISGVLILLCSRPMRMRKWLFARLQRQSY